MRLPKGLVTFVVFCAAGMTLVIPAAAQVPTKDLVRADAALSSVQKRVALVIGNKDYVDAPLKNPVNDANAMAQALKDLGFDVLLKTNLNNRQMVNAVAEFVQKLDKNTIGLFYFSGHGVQVDGINYLVPVAYTIERQADVAFEAFPAQRLLSSMGESGCSCNIVILDACRNNPLIRSVKALSNKGLGKMDAPSGTFIAYATAPGQTASDDPNKDNGLYTGVLLQKMKTPGLKIEEVFKATLVSVAEASGEKQVPWVESSLRNDFYFAAGLPTPVPETVVIPAKPKELETKGKLSVSVNAANSIITVDNQVALEGVFSMSLLDDDKKDVMVKVSAPGYEGKLISVTLYRGKTVSLPVVLEPIIKPNFVPQPLPDNVPIAPSNLTYALATIQTVKGTIQIKLFPEVAPNTVNNFIKLANKGFYNGLTFHRVVPGFVIQGGDPEGTGGGGPGWSIKNEDNKQLKHNIGAVAMANAGPDTAGSQFYIVITQPAPLDMKDERGVSKYSIFGQVISGQNVAEKIAVGDKMIKVSVQLPKGVVAAPPIATDGTKK